MKYYCLFKINNNKYHKITFQIIRYQNHISKKKNECQF